MPTTQLDEGPRTSAAYSSLRQRVMAMYPGVPLPPVPDMMEELSVSRATLDKVYGLLEQQGFIERKSRKGVFVTDRLATGEVAIVLNRILMEPGSSPVYARASSLLRDGLHAFNPKWAVKLHLGVRAETGPELPATLDLLEPHVLPRLRGVLSFHPLDELEDQLAAADVPVVYLGVDVPAWGPGVFLDRGQMLRDGIRHLAESGCRGVSLLHSRYVGKSAPRFGVQVPAVAAAAAECGLTFRDEWIGYEEGGWTERHGYKLFMRLWQNAERPDGIMVADDILCHGVLRAILELQLELPRDLRLVTHASRGIELPFHRPVSRVEYDSEEWANKAVRMLEARVRGIPLEAPAEILRATLVRGETT